MTRFLCSLHISVILVAILETVVRGQQQSCIRRSFPETTEVKSFLNGTKTGSTEHLQYVANVFKAMEGITRNCSANPDMRRVTYRSVPYPVFADGVQSKLFQKQQRFSASNAQVVVNLLLASPPTAQSVLATSAKVSYCYTEAGGTCTDCNSWNNDLFFESHMRATLTSQPDSTATGVCMKTSPTEMDCREATSSKGSIATSRRSNMRIASCDEPWLWQKPQEIFNNQLATGGFNSWQDVEIVFRGFSPPSNVHFVTSNTSAWSTVHSQCNSDGSSQWVHINTVPIIAVCTVRLVQANLCVHADLTKLVIVGSSWMAFALKDAYNISQCPATSVNPATVTSAGNVQDNVFTASAVCGRARLSSNATLSLQCANRLNGFQPNSYTCACPVTYHLDAKSPSNTTALPGRQTVYFGSYVAALSGAQAGTVAIATCQSCQPGCRSCVDSSPCLRADDAGLRVPILVVNILAFAAVILTVFYLRQYSLTSIIQSSAPFYLMGILFSALFAGLESIILFPHVNNVTCAMQPWPRHIGFILLFGFIFGKLWRVQVLARLPPGRIFIRTLDAGVQKMVFLATGVMVLYLTLWTAISRSKLEIIFDERDNSYERCTVDYWRYTIHGVEFIILILGCIVAQATRKLVLEWTEYKFMLSAFANAAIIKCLIAVFYFTLMPNKYADYLYLLQFFDSFFTITITLIILFGHKLYLLHRQKGDRSIGPTIPSKISRKESNSDLPVQEVQLQDISQESRRASDHSGKQTESLSLSLFDVIFGCCCGQLKSEWSQDHCALKPAKNTGDGRAASISGENENDTGEAELSKGEEDSGLPYMGDE